jgi:DNA primase
MDVREVIDRINEDIAQVVGNYVDLKIIGNKYKACCPFHNEKTPSFTVTPARGIYKCYGCGKGGDAVSFIQEHEGVPFKEALEIGAKKLNIDFQWITDKSNFNDEEYKHKESLKIVCQKAAEFFAGQLKLHPEAIKYLKDRGFDPHSETWREPVKVQVPDKPAEAKPVETDPLFHDAAELTILAQKASISYIQRKLSIGSKRAEKIMAQLEAAGIVGPVFPMAPRTVILTDLEQLKSISFNGTPPSAEPEPEPDAHVTVSVKDNHVLPFMIGFAPDGNELLKWAKKEAIKLNLLIEADLVKSKESHDYDTFRNRIMFPVANKSGKIIGFTGRTLSTDKATPKYLNTGDTPIYTKGNELFAINLARNEIRREDKAYLVEGNFDVARMHQIGVLNTIAPCGTALTVEQARLLKTYTNKVTLIYDGDSAGQKAMSKNAEILIREQFHVSVIILAENEDPDTAFPTLEAFENANNRQVDYIVHKTICVAEKSQNPAYKADLIKEISFLVTRYDEPSKHEVYLDEIAKIIGPKKLWQDHFKAFLADKAPVETKKSRAIPASVSLDEYYERGFYVDRNCMFFQDSKGSPKQQSNFTMTPLFHIESTVNAKRLYEVKNNHGTVRVIEIPQRDLVSISAFKVRIESLGNFLWTGSETDLNRLKAWLYEKTNSAKEVTQMGWNKDGIYVWGNGIYNGKFTETDGYGIATNNGENYYIPSASRIYSGEENLFEFERKFIHVEGNISLREYMKKFTKVFGDNGKIALSYYFASLFRDVIIRKFSKYPILNLFGPKGAGKNACAESLLHFFGRLPKIPNLHNTSKPALADHVATSSNALCVLDEYRNDLEMEKREFLKGLWDGTGRTRMNMDKDKKKETTSVDQGVIVCGQQMATADIALFSRFVVLSFTQTEFSKEEIRLYEELEEINKRGLTHITHQILKHRPYFKENYSKKVDDVSLKLEELLKGQPVETRVFNNWLMIMAAYATLDDEIELPWDYTETMQLAVDLMLRQNSEMKKNDDLGHFWKIVAYLASSNLIYDDGDYKLVYTREAGYTKMEEGKWLTQKIQWIEPKNLFYLTTSRVFSMYKSQCLREGDKPLPEATIEYYLKNSKAFLFETKKESFKKIDPRTGQQEVITWEETGPDNEKITKTKKKRTSTTAFVFDYNMLNISIETGGDELADADRDHNAPAAIETPVERAATETQAQIKFGSKPVDEPAKDDLPF